MISAKEAIDIILSEVRPLGFEKLPLLSSIERVIAEDITATRANPPLDNSAMDGYAVKSSDTKGASEETPVILKVIADLPAGGILKDRVNDGETVRIMTGAPIPDGADAVVMVEYTERSETRNNKTDVKIFREAKPGDNIRRAGEDFKIGDVVIQRGKVIRAPEVAMMATLGISYITTYQKPSVAVLSTGDELVDIYEPPTEGKIVNSNSYAIAAQIIGCGGQPVQLGIARDNKDDLEEKLCYGLNCDCIVSSGGVSVGDFDFVKDVLKDMGSDMRFWKVAMKPGKPLAFGTIGGKPAFGLPGNPISSMVAFEQFVRPALLKMAGRKDIFKTPVVAKLSKEIKKKPGRVHFVRAVLERENNNYRVTPLGEQGSGIISTMVRSNALILLPTEGTSYTMGDV
ncbi:MAG: gephyrin-like molybdotransferase Glp, partial [Thermodesulfobacteriota bacterium]